MRRQRKAGLYDASCAIVRRALFVAKKDIAGLQGATRHRSDPLLQLRIGAGVQQGHRSGGDVHDPSAADFATVGALGHRISGCRLDTATHSRRRRQRRCGEFPAMLLELDGQSVSTLYGAVEALEAATRLKPEILYLDIGLPLMDGYEVARYLRSQSETSALRLVAVTGYEQKEDRERVLASGFDDHLVKLVMPEALEALFRAQ
jgi:CheY-like chemotaxis protein